MSFWGRFLKQKWHEISFQAKIVAPFIIAFHTTLESDEAPMNVSVALPATPAKFSNRPILPDIDNTVAVLH
jgi:hypothetical protein